MSLSFAQIANMVSDGMLPPQRRGVLDGLYERVQMAESLRTVPTESPEAPTSAPPAPTQAWSWEQAAVTAQLGVVTIPRPSSTLPTASAKSVQQGPVHTLPGLAELTRGPRTDRVAAQDESVQLAMKYALSAGGDTDPPQVKGARDPHEADPVRKEVLSGCEYVIADERLSSNNQKQSEHYRATLRHLRGQSYFADSSEDRLKDALPGPGASESWQASIRAAAPRRGFARRIGSKCPTCLLLSETHRQHRETIMVHQPRSAAPTCKCDRSMIYRDTISALEPKSVEPVAFPPWLMDIGQSAMQATCDSKVPVETRALIYTLYTAMCSLVERGDTGGDSPADDVWKSIACIMSLSRSPVMGCIGTGSSDVGTLLDIPRYAMSGGVYTIDVYSSLLCRLPEGFLKGRGGEWIVPFVASGMLWRLLKGVAAQGFRPVLVPTYTFVGPSRVKISQTSFQSMYDVDGPNPPDADDALSASRSSVVSEDNLVESEEECDDSSEEGDSDEGGGDHESRNLHTNDSLSVITGALSSKQGSRYLATQCDAEMLSDYETEEGQAGFGSSIFCVPTPDYRLSVYSSGGRMKEDEPTRVSVARPFSTIRRSVSPIQQPEDRKDTRESVVLAAASPAPITSFAARCIQISECSGQQLDALRHASVTLGSSTHGKTSVEEDGDPYKAQAGAGSADTEPPGSARERVVNQLPRSIRMMPSPAVYNARGKPGKRQDSVAYAATGYTMTISCRWLEPSYSAMCANTLTPQLESKPIGKSKSAVATVNEKIMKQLKSKYGEEFPHFVANGIKVNGMQISGNLLASLVGAPDSANVSNPLFMTNESATLFHIVDIGRDTDASKRALVKNTRSSTGLLQWAIDQLVSDRILCNYLSAGMSFQLLLNKQTLYLMAVYRPTAFQRADEIASARLAHAKAHVHGTSHDTSRRRDEPTFEASSTSSTTFIDFTQKCGDYLANAIRARLVSERTQLRRQVNALSAAVEAHSIWNTVRVTKAVDGISNDYKVFHGCYDIENIKSSRNPLQSVLVSYGQSLGWLKLNISTLDAVVPVDYATDLSGAPCVSVIGYPFKGSDAIPGHGIQQTGPRRAQIRIKSPELQGLGSETLRKVFQSDPLFACRSARARISFHSRQDAYVSLSSVVAIY